MRVGRGEVVEAQLLEWLAWAEEGRSYEFHCGHAAAELGLRRRGGSGGN